MNERPDKSPHLEEIPVDDPADDERRYAERVEVRDVQFEAVFQMQDRAYHARVIDLSAIGFLVEFSGEMPSLRPGHCLDLAINLLGNVFSLQTVVRRVRGRRVALWLPDVVAGNVNDGMRLQDIVLELKNS